MSDFPQTHALRGFLAAAIKFVRALERNREKIATDRGLSASELRALFWIAEQGSARPKDLAEHMEMTTGGASRRSRSDSSSWASCSGSLVPTTVAASTWSSPGSGTA